MGIVSAAPAGSEESALESVFEGSSPELEFATDVSPELQLAELQSYAAAELHRRSRRARIVRRYKRVQRRARKLWVPACDHKKWKFKGKKLNRIQGRCRGFARFCKRYMGMARRFKGALKRIISRWAKPHCNNARKAHAKLWRAVIVRRHRARRALLKRRRAAAMRRHRRRVAALKRHRAAMRKRRAAMRKRRAAWRALRKRRAALRKRRAARAKALRRYRARRAARHRRCM